MRSKAKEAIQILFHRVKAIKEDVRIKAESIEIASTLIPRKSVTQPFHPTKELSKI
jgi:hypothetical protein